MTPELTSCYSYCHITYILVGTYYITYNLLICIILLVCFFFSESEDDGNDKEVTIPADKGGGGGGGSSGDSSDDEQGGTISECVCLSVFLSVSYMNYHLSFLS